MVHAPTAGNGLQRPTPTRPTRGAHRHILGRGCRAGLDRNAEHVPVMAAPRAHTAHPEARDRGPCWWRAAGPQERTGADGRGAVPRVNPGPEDVCRSWARG
jgi:hypothetical protein